MNKYETVHQSKREMARRLRQIKAGTLPGNESFLPSSTRMAAVGLHVALPQDTAYMKIGDIRVRL